MRTIFKSIIYISFASLLVVGCAKNDDFTTPDVNQCDEPQLKANKSIEDIFKVSSKDTKQYTSTTQDVISGVVVSSDEGGNFYRDVYIETVDGGVAARIKVNRGGTYGLYPVGRIIHIKMNGLYTQLDNSVLTIGQNDPVKGYTAPITNISKHIFRSCTTITGDSFNKTYNHIVTLKEALSDNYLGKLVTIKDVQFKKEFWGKTFYDKENIVSSTNKATNVGIVGKEAVPSTIIFRVAEQANGFKNEIVPAKSGTMTGVMTKFINDYQFVPRTFVDLKGLDQAPFEGSTGGDEGEDPNMKVEPGKFLAFPGSDFEKWDDFIAVTANKKVESIAVKADKLGWNNSTGLAIKGNPSANGALFTIQKVKIPADATKMSFLMKGTSAKSLSFNMYKKNGTNYYAYNVASLGTNKVVKPNLEEAVYDGVPSGNTGNSYDGKIDTKGQWIKVVLDLKDLKGDIHTAGTGNFLSLRVGKGAEYDLIIDEIRFEDGTPNDGGTVEPKEEGIDRNDPATVADFSKWEGFIGSLNSYKLLSVLGSENKAGKDGKAALQIKGTHTKNDYLFTIENQTVKKDAKKIVMYVKGTAAKSLSFNVYRGTDDDKGNKTYDVFNIRTDEQIAGNKVQVDLKEDIVLKKTAKMQSGTNKDNGNNDYMYTSIDSGSSKWIKITLDISNVDYNKSGKGSVFSIKTGSGADYNLLVSDIVFE